MSKLIQTIILTFCCFNLFSQSDSIKKSHIYTSPLHAINIITRQMVTLGYEYIFSNNIGLCSELGYKYIDNSYTIDTIFLKSKGYSARMELKYYDSDLLQRKKIKSYYSLEYRYIRDEHNANLTYTVDSLEQDRISDCFGVIKDISIVNIKYGMVFHLGKVLYIDFYAGIGVRYRNIRNTNVEFDENLGHHIYAIENSYGSSELKKESGYSPNGTLGFKFGIRF